MLIGINGGFFPAICRACLLIFYRILIDFPNPFIVHSRPSFLFEPNFLFVVFVHMRNFDIDFLFLKKFFLIFFENWFPNSLIVRARSCFLFNQWKFFELYVRTCLATFFKSLYLLITFFVLHKAQFSRLTSDLLLSVFQLNGF